MGRKKKAPGEGLEKELKSTLDNMSSEELKAKVSEVALYKRAQEDLMKQDPDIKQAKDAVKLAEQDYKDEIKGANEQIGYIKFLLESKGKL